MWTTGNMLEKHALKCYSIRLLSFLQYLFFVTHHEVNCIKVLCT